mmetsp:Transcript_30383/g.70090  ORF Transcript_30383/g.70090 Transcript_30383/m.70090 type:complete len:394 (-) Transcript_30383:116-1297(-)|eukprot:CAMPEP_0114561864 /NCGR_PEP_ID=MMETSP0114-20121206/12226_1 /TAXON_ID=31324 /ORGANISM="Goniomonas sp, Strain m" /LENGTH=393 /DNA_ID=CAMNT_0001747517 /DNA_START=64 /DNA_END=1245 /DNA_ORIENTATION=+
MFITRFKPGDTRSHGTGSVGSRRKVGSVLAPVASSVLEAPALPFSSQPCPVCRQAIPSGSACRTCEKSSVSAQVAATGTDTRPRWNAPKALAESRPRARVTEKFRPELPSPSSAAAAGLLTGQRLAAKHDSRSINVTEDQMAERGEADLLPRPPQEHMQERQAVSAVLHDRSSIRRPISATSRTAAGDGSEHNPAKQPTTSGEGTEPDQATTFPKVEVPDVPVFDGPNEGDQSVRSICSDPGDWDGASGYLIDVGEEREAGKIRPTSGRRARPLSAGIVADRGSKKALGFGKSKNLHVAVKDKARLHASSPMKSTEDLGVGLSPWQTDTPSPMMTNAGRLLTPGTGRLSKVLAEEMSQLDQDMTRLDVEAQQLKYLPAKDLLKSGALGSSTDE